MATFTLVVVISRQKEHFFFFTFFFSTTIFIDHLLLFSQLLFLSSSSSFRLPLPPVLNLLELIFFELTATSSKVSLSPWFEVVTLEEVADRAVAAAAADDDGQDFSWLVLCLVFVRWLTQVGVPNEKVSTSAEAVQAMSKLLFDQFIVFLFFLFR